MPTARVEAALRIRRCARWCGRGKRTILAMTIPIVTELPRVLEAVTADTFIAGDQPVRPFLSVRSRRIFD